MSTRRWAALFGLVGAAPTLLWAAHGSGLIYDDWRYAAAVRFDGVGHLLSTAATRDPGRPGQAVYYSTTYGLFGTHPLPHALALAALNAAAAGLVFIAAEHLWGRRVALPTAFAWAVFPNRGSTRLWFATAPEVLAVCLLLVAVVLLAHDRPAWAGATLAAATVTYESVLALGVAAFVVWAWQSRPDRMRRTAAALVPVGAAAAYIWIHSPKRPGNPHPLSHLPALVSAQIGRGNFGPAADVGAAMVLLVLAVATATAVVPGFTLTTTHRRALAGATITVLGAAPFLVTRFPFATEGIFDRGNIAPDLGIAIILGAVAAWFIDHVPRPMALLVVAVMLGYPALLNAQDLHDFRRAVRDGTRLQAQMAHDVPSVSGVVVVGPPLPHGGGVAQFLSSDIGYALDLERGSPHLHARMACPGPDFATTTDPYRYDRVARTLRHQGPAGLAPPREQRCD